MWIKASIPSLVTFQMLVMLFLSDRKDVEISLMSFEGKCPGLILLLFLKIIVEDVTKGIIISHFKIIFNRL